MVSSKSSYRPDDSLKLPFHRPDRSPHCPPVTLAAIPGLTRASFQLDQTSIDLITISQLTRTCN